MADLIDVTQLAKKLPFLGALMRGESPSTPGGLADDQQQSVPNTLSPVQQAMNAPAVQAQTQQPPGDLNDLTQSMAQGRAPNLKNRFMTAEQGEAPKPTKLGMLATLLRSATMGGLNGVAANAQTYAATGRNAGFGGGFEGAQVMPIQRQLLQGQATRLGLENTQLAQLLPFLRQQNAANLFKTVSEGQKASAEAGAIPSKVALEQAQAAAASWKTGPNGSLVNIRTGQTYQGQTAPLSAEEAQALGKNPGDVVPIDIKNKASEIVTRGHTNVSTSEGVFDYNRATGQKTRLGTPPAMAVINNNQLTDDNSLNMAADYYAQTGQLPSGFGRSPATTAAIIKRASDRHAGEDIAKNKLDYEATKKYMGTLNGNQQVRLRQAIGFASDSLDKLQGLYSEWQTLAPQSGFKILNRATLSAMKNVPGRAGAVANALEAQIADLTSELGNIYMGGNSPTDHSLSLAQKNLSADWNKETFDEAISQVRKNLYIRKNSIMNAAPAGVSNNSLFQPQDTANTGGPTADDLLKKYPPKGK